MSGQSSAVIIGGTSGIGRQVAKVLVDRGEDVVITGRDKARTQAVAAEIGGRALAMDLTHPEEIAGRLADIGQVNHLVIAAIDRDENTVRKYDIARATRLVTLKLIGYTEVVHTLVPRLTGEASIVLFGGLAKERPYPGSTTVTTVNGGVTSMVRTLAMELAPVRVNAVHPGIVGDSPAWMGKPPEVLERVRVRTPTGRLASMADVADAVVFLLDNSSVNGVNLNVDGGWLLL
jgi:NAD(P)-dependent dehydrogenase (short-subunit alcohol dehydrogenase family)